MIMSSTLLSHFLFEPLLSIFSYSIFIDELMYPIEHLSIVSDCIDELFSDDTVTSSKYDNSHRLPEICCGYSDEIL